MDVRCGRLLIASRKTLLMSFAFCAKEHWSPARIQVRARPKPTCFQGSNRPHMALVLCNQGVCPRRIKRIRLVDPGETSDLRPRSRPCLFNLAIGTKLRGCDVVAIRVEDVAAGGYREDRARVRQKKTGRQVRFELSEQTRQAVDDYLRVVNKRPGEFLFTGRRCPNRNMTTRQDARLVSEWIGSVGLDPRLFGTHSLRRPKATLIYRRAGKLQALHPFLRPSKNASTVRLLWLQVGYAISNTPQVYVRK